MYISICIIMILLDSAVTDDIMSWDMEDMESLVNLLFPDNAEEDRTMGIQNSMSIQSDTNINNGTTSAFAPGIDEYFNFMPIYQLVKWLSTNGEQASL